MPHSSGQILVVDDEPTVRKLLKRCLEKEGFSVHEASDSIETLAVLQSHDIDLVTLDISLDGEDGIDLARELRSRSSVPIIMVSGKGDLIDTVVGLEVGADDYISKPFQVREVVARVRAVLRRYQAAEGRSEPMQLRSTETRTPETHAIVAGTHQYKFDNWTLDSATRELLDADNNEVMLTTGEFDLLLLFATTPRRVLSRDQIMDALKGNDWLPNDRTIDNQVARLRKKLVKGDRKSPLIKTVRGSGYLFTPEVNVT